MNKINFLPLFRNIPNIYVYIYEYDIEFILLLIILTLLDLIEIFRVI